MSYTYIYASIGVFLTLIGFVIYNARDGKINTASWLLWVVGDTLEVGTYFVMTGEDVLKNAVPIAFAIGSCVTFAIALFRRRFGVPDRVDVAVMTVDLTITAGWLKTLYSAAAANIMLVATELLSFIPLYRGVLRGEEKELAAPWLLWAAGDLFFLATVLSLAHTTEEMIYPVVQSIAHILVVVCIAARRMSERTPA